MDPELTRFAVRLLGLTRHPSRTNAFGFNGRWGTLGEHCAADPWTVAAVVADHMGKRGLEYTVYASEDGSRHGRQFIRAGDQGASPAPAWHENPAVATLVAAKTALRPDAIADAHIDALVAEHIMDMPVRKLTRELDRNGALRPDCELWTDVVERAIEARCVLKNVGSYKGVTFAAEFDGWELTCTDASAHRTAAELYLEGDAASWRSGDLRLFISPAAPRPYTSDIAAAWSVVERMRDPNLRPDTEQAAEAWDAFVGRMKEPPRLWGLPAAKAARHICITALRAAGVELGG